MNFTEELTKAIGLAARMTRPELEEAAENSEHRTIAELTALSLARRAAEGGMDAIKLIRELAKGTEQTEAVPRVEVSVIPPTNEDG
ncbi:MAG: hypothetical protein IJC46_03275 [Clostridia bacterium]|nr:hypothetical protein [Clostridia bacterium]